MRPWLVLGSLLALAACGDKPAGPAEAKVAAVTPEVQPAGNPQCAMFSTVQIAGYAGEPVNETRDAAGGRGCEWLANDGSGSVVVTVTVPAEHVVTTAADGFKPLSNIGTQGFVAGGPGSWSAGAITGDKAVAVAVTSDKSTESGTVGLLESALARAGR